MKYVLLCVALISVSGCGIGWIDKIPDGYYGDSMTIGVDVGLPEGLSLVIGYRKHTGIICKNDTYIRVKSDTAGGTQGLDVIQTVAFGKEVPVSDDITINEQEKE